MLGGVTIDGAAGLAGHSDADASRHAVADALLGAAGLPDLGTLFPASDDAYRDASSLELRCATSRRGSRAEGWSVGQRRRRDRAETPRLAPHLDAMARPTVRAAALGGDVQFRSR